ncbi:uncharacterized protein LOC123467803 [Daphnia magna]|uniref:uncharacterized protein LOC123467803 n=1 Tax=Daphnia magna TaxID=35525 RepID=UPI001E1BD3AD|nr:uncharacterized protein LOC123467803 [Daphnia magna]
MGLDYTGVINIRIKGTKEVAQAYILLMTCGFSRALHLEVVQDMSTESFLKAFRRYTGHHRLPRLIISDNASTFITASGYLTKLFNDHQVTRFLNDRNIQWKFIPKRVPWYGGFWERLVAMAKNVLTKMVGLNKLTLEELQTVVCEIEAVLNDRKLTNIPSEIDGLTPLTPSHLLYGERLTIFPQDIAMEEELDDPSYGERASFLSKSYFRIQNVKKSFVRMWNNVYLPSLREHHQRTRGPIKEIIKVGDIVQIHNECKRYSWKLAVVENVIRGADGKVRAADVRTANGKTNRPINKLYPLELSEEEEPVVPSSLAKESIISSNSTTDDERPAPAVWRPARRAAAKRADCLIFSIAQLESINEFEE